MLARAMLQLTAGEDRLVSSSQQADYKNLIMEEARSILELTKYIDAEPWTPLWSVSHLKSPVTSQGHRRIS